jgi:hypothetical protein
MEKAERPQRFAFRDRYLAAISAAALLLCSMTVQSQVIQKNTQYGVEYARLVPDSTLYFPTGCGAPSGIASLRSVGFGNGEKKRMAAIYADTCGHAVYWLDWSDTTWKPFGTAGGDTDTTSLSNRINQKLNWADTATMLTAYLRAAIAAVSYYPLSTNPAGYLTSNGLPAVINALQVVNAGGAASWASGTYTSRPTPGVPNRFYAATDSAKIYFDNGSTWLTISGGSGTPTIVWGGITGMLSSQTDLAAALAAKLTAANNLNDLNNVGVARTNLGLGTAAQKDVPSSGNASTSQVVQGNDTRLTDSRAPSGPAAGSLSGTYPNPSIANNVIGNSNLTTMPANTFKINNTGSSTAPIDATLSQMLTALGMDTLRTNVWLAIASKMTNYGNSPGSLKGTYAGIPAATGYPTGTEYIATDSGFHYVDTGSGGTRGWKRIAGSGAGGGSQTLQQVLNTGSILTKPDTVYQATNPFLFNGPLINGDTIRANEIDTLNFWGYSVTLGLTVGSAQLPLPYAKQVAQAYGSYYNNKAISGTRLVKLGAGDSSMQERINQIQPYTPGTSKYLFFEYTINDAIAGIDTTRYGVVWDSVLNMAITTRGWPANRVFMVAGTLTDTVAFTPVNPVRWYANIARRKAQQFGTKYIYGIDYLSVNGGLLNIDVDGIHPKQRGHNQLSTGILSLLDSVNYIRSNNVVVEKTLSVNGNATVGKNISIAGAASVTGNQSIGGTLNLTGNVLNNTTFNKGVTITGDATFSQQQWLLYRSGNSRIGMGVGLVGIAPFASTVDIYGQNNNAIRLGIMSNTDGTTFTKYFLASASGDSAFGNLVATGNLIGQRVLGTGGMNIAGDATFTQKQVNLYHVSNAYAGLGIGAPASPTSSIDIYGSTSNIAVRAALISGTDGTTVIPLMQWYTNSITAPSNMLPTGSGTDSVVVETTTSGIMQLKKVAQSSIAGLGGIRRLAPIDSVAKVANGAQVIDSSLVLQSADASFAGLVTTGTQSFAGNKTFANDIILASPGGSGNNDSTLTWDPVTKKIRISGRTFNFTAKNGNRLRTSDTSVVRGGALDEDTYTPGGNFSIYEGTSGSNLDSFAVYAATAYFNSTPFVGTRSANDNSTRAASTAYVDAAVGAVTSGQNFAGTADLTVANSTSFGQLLPTGIGSATAAANTLTVGKTIHVKAQVIISTKSSGTVQPTLYWWGDATGFQGAPVTLTNSMTNVIWYYEGYGTVRTTGASGTIVGYGRWFSDGGAVQASRFATTLNTTVSNTFSPGIMWDSADPSNTITVKFMEVTIK